MSILGRLEEVDNQIDKINGMITKWSGDDPELGAGAAAGIVTPVQREIDKAAAAVDELDAHLRLLARMMGR